MKIKLRKDSCGSSIGDFQDIYGKPCSIKKSCFVNKDTIRFGRIGGGPARMHLDQKLVKALLPLLKRFVKTGELEG